jgi:signal transduction histidine kinase/CheY-like chemotaxis protein
MTMRFEPVRAHFDAKREALLTRWRELARTDRKLPEQRLRLTDQELDDHLRVLLQDIIKALGGDEVSEEKIERQGAEHGRTRRMGGYKIGQVGWEFALFRQLIRETLDELAATEASSTLFAARELLMHLVDKSEFGSMEQYVQDTARERDAAREKFRAANEQKDRFLAVLSHELRNPLAAARTALHVLRKEGTGDNQRERALDIIDRQTRSQTRLIDDLLDVNRISQGKIELRRELIDLRKSAENAIEPFVSTMDSKGIVFKFNRPDFPLSVVGDPVRIEQIISNLLANAIQFTRAGDSIQISLLLDRVHSVIYVRDTGAGFDSAMMNRLFELFAQAETSPGTGLGVGLWLAKMLTEMHEGTIQASSDGLGKGTEVIVRLLFAREQPEARDEPLATRVLLVEDSPDQREMMLLALSDQHIEVIGAADGADALAQLPEKRFDICILDLNLPDISGYELAGRILAHHGQNRPLLVALTGYGRHEDTVKTTAAGFDHHLVKPADIDVLQRIIYSRARA